MTQFPTEGRMQSLGGGRAVVIFVAFDFSSSFCCDCLDVRLCSLWQEHIQHTYLTQTWVVGGLICIQGE